ncbi:3'-5' exonuclease [Hymenobacter aquaticus]|uniref:3'-5' exonuclease n=1 Tax=Hymenobacter aquaticus TaxID=1867101 RepID=A0A4Z0Q2K4_9BACT|nr:3'-5' exonuclease [Hymenobacter aquaticus]TGE23915.1 3'-5' exonuclease [Hymenobacter aquaticus]
MKSNKILFLDTETGGLDPEINSLLSVGFIVWQEGKILDGIEILINDEVLNVSEYALKINKINIADHRKNAFKSVDAINKINEFISKHFSKTHHVTLAGHNVGFDVSFLRKFYEINKISFKDRFSHRYIDTSSIIKFLYLSGVLDIDVSSSDAAFKYYSINVEGRHSALGDATATALLFNNLMREVDKSRKYI